MEARLDRITEHPLLTQQLDGQQGRLEELSKQIALAAALVDDVKKEQAAAARARALGAPADSGGYLRLAKLKFPTFSGTFPRLWITKCASYFEFYAMPTELWVPWASMHMEGRAQLWMWTYEKRRGRDWDQFCQAVGADDHRRKILALMHLKQEGSMMTVREYRDRFEECMYHVMLFDPSMGMSSIFSVGMFVNGLREDIRAVVLPHSPATVTDAADLALLQEEACDQAMQRA
uniref:Retrotransposon gag domain-containing protein n=1 Tax=Oryza brachyantha TaxID=4533 RepID=J3LMY6_ORYBR